MGETEESLALYMFVVALRKGAVYDKILVMQFNVSSLLPFGEVAKWTIAIGALAVMV